MKRPLDDSSIASSDNFHQHDETFSQNMHKDKYITVYIPYPI